MSDRKQVYRIEDLALSCVVYDWETNGLFPEVSRVHSLCVMDLAGNYLSCAQDKHGNVPLGLSPISVGLEALAAAAVRVAHNAIDFDERVTKKFFPLWAQKMAGKRVLDTVIMSQFLYPDVHRTAPNNSRCPQHLRSRHSVKAWGYRLGENKADYEGGFEEWNPEMSDYMVQDCTVLLRIFKFFMAQKPNMRSLQLEHDFAELMQEQTERGFTFDMEKAVKLNAKLQDRQIELTKELRAEFGEWWAVKKGQSNQDKISGEVTPQKTRSVKLSDFPDIVVPRYGKKGQRLKDYVGPPKETVTEGCPYTPIYRHEFNPGSRADCIHVLKTQYDWKPSKTTESGLAALDEEVLLELEAGIPEAAKLLEYFTVAKRIGQLSAGKNAWISKARLNELTDEWRIHGRVKTLGTMTHRCSHVDPNMGQVPNMHAPYGPECRALFIPRKGFILAGSDADAAQLRMLGHYLAKFDGGEFANKVHAGKKEDKTDAHSWFAYEVVGEDILGLKLREGESPRDRAKTLRYAKLFGAGKRKQGITAQPWLSDADATALGAEIERRVALYAGAEAELEEALRNYAEENYSIRAIDGRILPLRSVRAALNTLLMSAEAIMMKKVLVQHAQLCAEAGLIKGKDWDYVANVHDEFQMELHPDVKEPIAKASLEAYEIVGERMKLKCPFVGTIDFGMDWSQTH